MVEQQAAELCEAGTLEGLSELLPGQRGPNLLSLEADEGLLHHLRLRLVQPDQEGVRVEDLDPHTPADVFWEVRQVESQQVGRLRSERRLEHMDVIRVRQRQQRRVMRGGNLGLRENLIHEFGRALHAQSVQIRAVLKEVAHPLLLDPFGPARAHQRDSAQPHHQVAEPLAVEDVGITEDDGVGLHSVEVQVLSLLGQLVEQGVAPLLFLAVCQEIPCGNPAMTADPMEGEQAGVEQVMDEEGSADPKERGRLIGGELLLCRDDRQRFALLDMPEEIAEEGCKDGGKCHGAFALL